MTAPELALPPASDGIGAHERLAPSVGGRLCVRGMRGQERQHGSDRSDPHGIATW